MGKFNKRGLSEPRLWPNFVLMTRGCSETIIFLYLLEQQGSARGRKCPG